MPIKHTDQSESTKEAMSGFRLVLMYQVVLRPLCFVYLIASAVYFLKSSWLIGSFLLLMVFFAWLLWKWLQREIGTEAYVGPPAEVEEDEDDEVPKSPYPVSYEEATIISKALTAIGHILAATIIVFCIHYGMRIYLAIPVGIIAGWLSAHIVGRTFVAFSCWFEMEMMDWGGEGDR